MIGDDRLGWGRSQGISRGWHWFALIFMAGTIVRLVVAVLLPVAPFSDFLWYVERARELAAGLGFQERGHPTAYWPVGYPALLAGLMRLTGLDVAAAIVGNFLFWTLGFVALIGFARKLEMPELAIRLATALWAAYPAAIFYISQAASEAPYIALLLFACWASAGKGYGSALIAGALFGMATLLKAQTYLFPVVHFALLMLFARQWRTGRNLIRLALLYLALFTVVLPWSVRNYHQLGAFVLVSTNGGPTLLNGNNDYAKGRDVRETEDPGIREVFAQSGIGRSELVQYQVEQDKRTRALAWRWIKDHPVRFVGLAPRKFAYLWMTDTDASWSYQAQYPNASRLIFIFSAVNQIYYAGILLCVVLFVWLGLKRWRSTREIEPAHIALLSFAIFTSLICMIFSGQSRYHAPAMPFLILAAAAALVHLARLAVHEQWGSPQSDGRQ